MLCSKGLQVTWGTAFNLLAASTAPNQRGNTDEVICASPRMVADHFLLAFSGNTESWPCLSQAVGHTDQKVTVPEKEHEMSPCAGLDWSCTSKFFSFLFYLSVQQGT